LCWRSPAVRLQVGEGEPDWRPQTVHSAWDSEPTYLPGRRRRCCRASGAGARAEKPLQGSRFTHEHKPQRAISRCHVSWVKSSAGSLSRRPHPLLISTSRLVSTARLARAHTDSREAPPSPPPNICPRHARTRYAPSPATDRFNAPDTFKAARVDVVYPHLPISHLLQLAC
jgi:hypothetical protein